MISIYRNSFIAAVLVLSTVSTRVMAEQLDEDRDSARAAAVVKGEGRAKHRRIRADTDKKISELRKQIEALQLRIRAGDKAGQVLEDQLAEMFRSHEESAELEAQLVETRALAKREHQRAEAISAEVLRQVEAQKAIGRELQKMIADAKRERQELRAEREDQAKPDLEWKKRLVAENEKLSRSLKQAWEKAKGIEAERDEFREAIKTVAEQGAELKKLQPLLQLKGTLEEKLTELMQLERSLTEQVKKNESQAAARAELEEALAQSLGNHRLLEEKVAKLSAENSELQKKVVADRAEALRERILRKRVETQLEDIAAAQAQAQAMPEPDPPVQPATVPEDPEPRALTAAENAADVATNATDSALLEIAPIYFAKNQADSEAQERSLLAQLQEIHQRFPTARFSISGHTCTDGSASGNLALSERRAQRIADLIKNNGIPAAAIAGVIGKGEASPIADNNTQQGREANRRVEIKVLRE